jgi:hypothetical protein
MLPTAPPAPPAAPASPQKAPGRPRPACATGWSLATALLLSTTSQRREFLPCPPTSATVASRQPACVTLGTTALAATVHSAPAIPLHARGEPRLLRSAVSQVAVQGDRAGAWDQGQACATQHAALFATLLTTLICCTCFRLGFRTVDAAQ